MTDCDLILVDTNVILDVLEDDPRWAAWSADQMSRVVGRMAINPLIYTELGYEAGEIEDVERILVTLGLIYLEMPREALFLASKAYRTYRLRGGIKTAPPADFFIGAHAAVLGIPILTRDVSRYQSYFPDVELIAP
ncbi:PIN domain-containing protein [Akkermansiaceae bacterium]|nr:PIN domain-containing protein [Akkermansiaceae bacterium]